MKQLYPLAFLGLAALASCSDSTSTTTGPRTVTGSTVNIGGGTAQSWIRVDDANTPLSMGITFSDKALVGLPSDSAFHPFTLSLPAAERALTPFNHIEMDWNPLGHPPEHIYDKPHFDFHFYTIDTTEQMMILPGPDNAAVDTTMLPPFYYTDHQSVPMMGVHYSAGTDFAPNFNFTHTFIYGVTKGKFAFIEPMITKAAIEGTQNDTIALPQPTKYIFAGKYFPTKYAITTNTSAKTYTISLEGWVKR
jgi:hypothetical protein